MSLSGLVLVGGRSRRMGVDKATLPAPGGVGTLLDRQIATLRSAGAEPVFLAGRAGQTNPRPDLPWLTDHANTPGPLGGLLAGLEACPTTHLAVLAVDMPHFPAETFARWHACAPAGQGWVLGGNDGYEPLAALYPREALPILHAAAVDGVLRLQDHIKNLLKDNALRVWSEALPGDNPLSNWNNLEDIPPVRHSVS